MPAFKASQSLSGVRVWLSGSVPEESKSTEEERASIRLFVRHLADRIFGLGGHIIHGSHPSFTGLLLERAEAHRRNGGAQDSLILCVSRHFSRVSGQVPLDKWREQCTVYETPEREGPDARNESLETLRLWMAARSDAIVIVGGKWWTEVAGQSGVPIELSMAMERKLPVFLLGGLGGVARQAVNDNSHLFELLRNGLDARENARMAQEEDSPSLAEDVCNQLIRLPLVRGTLSEGASFRILALDGGGIKGTFTAAALAAWEEMSGQRCVDHFDLIAGTSTGGILAIGLAIGLPAKEILEFYRTRGPIIFPMTSFAKRTKHRMRHLFRPKFSQEVLLRELEEAFYRGADPIQLKYSKTRLLIPAYHALAGVSHVFRTPHHRLFTQDANKLAAHVALATAAAPTFFSAAKVGSLIAESEFLDGGVWANSPALAAIVEATCSLGVPVAHLDVLSVGTTTEPFTIKSQSRAGVLRWGKRLLSLLMCAQEESSLKYAKLLAGDPRFMRVNAVTQNGSYSLDSSGEIGQLASLGEHEALKPEVYAQIRSRFLNGVKTIPWVNFAT